MKPTSLIFLLTFLVAIVSSCKKEATTADTTTGKVSYYAKGTTSNSPTIKSVNSIKGDVQVSSVPNVKWKSASIFVNEISFEGTNSTQINTKKSVETNLNLFALDSIGNIELPAGEYKDVKVTLHLKKSLKSELSFWLNADFTDSKGNVYPLSIMNSDEFNIKLSVNGIKIDPSKSYKAIISYQLDNVFNGISTSDLENAYRSPNGVLGISSSVNTNLYQKIKENWQTLATTEFKEK